MALHRYVMDAPANVNIDHINRLKVDNRKSNLRFATVEENRRNVGPRKDNSTGVKGVYKQNNKFRACIRVNRKNIHLGYYSSLIDAAEVYDCAAKKYFGEFAFLNNLRERTPKPVSFLLSGKEKGQQTLDLVSR